ESVSFWKAAAVADIEAAIPEFMSTHPANAKRAENLDKIVPWALDLRRECNCAPLPQNKTLGVLNLSTHPEEKIMAPIEKHAGGLRHIPVIETIKK
ncbi:unnamed protein product, partial [Adineta steineri]